MQTYTPFTIQQHLFEEQRRHYPQASGEFSWLLSGITLATKMIGSRVRRAGLTDILGSTGEQNVQGDQVVGFIHHGRGPIAQVACPFDPVRLASRQGRGHFQADRSRPVFAIGDALGDGLGMDIGAAREGAPARPAQFSLGVDF